MIATLTPIATADYLLYNCKQGSPEWLNMRAGCITASEFVKARQKVDMLDARQKVYVDLMLKGNDKKTAMELAGYKAAPTSDTVARALAGEKVGRFSEVALNYAFRKAVERIALVPLDENVQTWQMKRGHKLEPFARMRHEDRLAEMPQYSHLMVLPAGFMTTPDGKFGCSVDGLIGDQGGSEYKCLVSADRMRRVIFDNDISEFMDQIQGCLWISGREWWHFGLYSPQLKSIGMEFQMIEVQRDDNYIDALEADLIEIEKVVTQYVDRLRGMGAHAIAEAVEAVKADLEREAGDVVYYEEA